MLFSHTAVCQTTSDNQTARARIAFEESEHDFGTFSAEKDSLQTHVFTFKNTGDKDLVILHAASGCGCTRPIYTKTPVKPGATGTITVTYNGKGQIPGYFRKSVTVYSNDPRSYVRIFIRGKLIRWFSRAKEKTAVFGLTVIFKKNIKKIYHNSKPNWGRYVLCISLFFRVWQTT